MDIVQFLNGTEGKNIIEGISAQTGINTHETSTVIQSAGPALLGLLKNNASNPQGAMGLIRALKEHDGSVLDNIVGFLQGDASKDGNAILGHIMGDKRNEIQTAISKDSGVSLASVQKILPLLAPIIMGFLGKQSKNNNVSTGGGLGDLLGGMLGGGQQRSGKVLGDILGGVLGGRNSGKKSGDGLLGSLKDMLGGKK